MSPRRSAATPSMVSAHRVLLPLVPLLPLLLLAMRPASAVEPEGPAQEAVYRVRDARTGRVSSWDRSGDNRDFISFAAGETKELLNLDGPGIITHVYMTPAAGPAFLRSAVLRMYWDDEETPSVEVPFGDFFCAGECRRRGYRALPVPASQVMDWERLRGHLSHRELGGLAGIGWRGRNNLLVHPKFGSQVRYVSILSDMPLPERGVERAARGDCGRCHACVGVCPAGAIAMDPGAFDLDKCTAQIRRFSQSEKLNVLICGICVRACRGTSGAAAASERESA